MNVFINLQKTTIVLAAAAVTGVLALAASAAAATVTWDAPVKIGTHGDADVSTQGTLVGAYTLGGTATSPTVNGVPFTAAFVPTYYNPGSQGLGSPTSVALGTMGSFAGNPYLYGDGAGETGIPTGLTTAYKLLVSSAIIPINNNFTNSTPLVLTLTNLAIGRSYLFQSWVNDSRAGTTSTRIEELVGGDNTSAVLHFSDTQNVTDAGGNGSFVIGHFIADSTSQTITYIGIVVPGVLGEVAQVNALQLREVPEPAALALLGLGSMMVGLRRRRNRK